MKLITVQLLVPDDDADTLVSALDAVSNSVSDRGYTDSEVERLRLDEGRQREIRYRICFGLHPTGDFP